MHRLLSNPPRSNGIGSLSPTPKRITRSPHDELHLRSIRGFVEDRAGAVDLSDELIRTSYSLSRNVTATGCLYNLR